MDFYQCRTMKIFWKIFCICLFLSALPTCAQELKLEAVKWVEEDHEAVEKPNYDGNKKLCALLKVYVDDLPGVVFGSGFILHGGTDTYDGKCYRLYVSHGMYRMHVKHADYGVLPIDVKQDFGLRFQTGKTYHLFLRAVGPKPDKTTQTVVFNMMPPEGSIRVNGQTYSVNKGMLSVELDPGEHTFTAEASDYQSREGKLSVVKDSSQPMVVPVKLKPVLRWFEFTCNAKDAQLYVDRKHQGGVGAKQLPLGRHHIRVVADSWNDYSEYRVFKPGDKLHVEMRPKLYVPVTLSIKGSITGVFIDNKVIEGWVNNRPFKAKTGKHLITVTYGNLGSKDMVINVVPDMDVIDIDVR